MKICIAGVGTYGSYLANALCQNYPEAEIVLVDVGNEQIATEQEIGFRSQLVNNKYNAASKGRYFGLGGTSSMWGGQLLFFSESDCPNDKSIKYLKELNLKHSKKVLSRFFQKIPELSERSIRKGLFIKKGIWLEFNKRNLYKYFNLRNKRVKIIPNSRVVKLNKNNDKIESITITTRTGQISELYADLFFVSCGAFETMRILDNSEIISLQEETAGFCDHVSIRSFRIKSLPILFDHDFSYLFLKKSLLTSRIIGEHKGVAFYIQPIFNEDFIFFQFLKELIFKRKISIKKFIKSIRQFFYLFPFAYYYFIKKKLYVYGGWELNIDVELFNTKNFIKKSNLKDDFSINSIDINYEVPEEIFEIINVAKGTLKQLLDESKIVFEELDVKLNTLKLEDTYHPFKLYNSNTEFLEKFNPLPNLFVCHTGLLDRAGGLNPTAVLFCLIEELVNTNFKIRNNEFKS